MAYTDPFDFLSTRLNPEKSIFTEDAIKFLPTIPADFRVNSSNVGTTTNPNSVFDLLSQRLNNLPDNLPAYQYTTQQERRYNNPYLQYTPTNVLGTDTEDIYGRYQGAGEQLFNSIVKMGANAVGTFASSFLTAPATFDLIRQGKYVEAFEEDSLFSTIQDGLIALEDKFPNYYTSLERNRTDWINAFSPTGAMNFWGDKVLKNIGFSLGGLASGLVVDAGIELLSGGTATPVTFIAAANQFQKAYKNLFRGFRDLTKGSNQIDNIIDASKLTGSVAKGLQVSNLSRIKSAARFAGTTYLGAQGESFIEGYHTYIDTKKQLLEEAIQRNEVDSETLREIEERAQHAGRWTAALNIPIITASNLFQFPNLLTGKSLLAATNKFITTEIGEQGIKAVSDFSTKRAVKQWAVESLKDVFTEGLEEGSQYHISNSLHDYYVDRVNPKIKESVLGFLVDNIPDSLTDEQFWSEAAIGGLTGFLMGAPATIPTITRGKQRTDNLVNHLNNSYERFNSLVKQYTKTIDLNSNLDERDKQISAHDALFASVHDSLKFGTYDTFLDSLNDLKDLDVQEYNKAFGTEFESSLEKDAHLQSVIQDAQSIRQSILKVNQFYPKNPYSKPYLTKKIQRALSPKSDAELSDIQENLFNDYKEVIARNEFLLQKTNGQLLKYKDNLKTFGVKDESISYIASLHRTKKGFQSYLDWKKSQIKDLKRQVDYYSKLSQSDTTLTPELKPKEEQKKYEDLLNKTEEYLETIQELFKETSTDDKVKKKKVQELLTTLVLLEETNEQDRERFQQNREEDAKKAQQTQQDLDALIEEQQILSTETNEIQEQLIEIQKQAAEESIPHPDPVPLPEPVVDPNEWLKKYNIGDKTPKDLLITDKGEDFLIVEDDLGNKYKVYKEEDKIITEPLSISGIVETVDLSQSVEITKKQNLPVKVNKEDTITLKERLNETVLYKGKPFVLKKDGERYILDSETTIVDLDGNDNSTLSEFNIKDLPEQQLKYKVLFINEDTVNVNGITYYIRTNKSGNIIGLSPENNPEQTIKNEQLLVAVEIERNKQEFTDLEEVVNNITEEEYLDIKKDNPILLLIEGIYEKNLNDTVQSGLDKLYSEQELTDNEKLAVDIWVTDGIVELTKLYVRFLESEEVKNALDNLEIINKLLYTQDYEKYKRKPIETTGTSNVSKRKIKQPKEQKVKVQTEEQPLVTSGTEEALELTPIEETQQEPVAVQTQLQLGTEEFTTSEIFNYPGTVWLKKGTSLVDSAKVYSLENGFIYSRKLAQHPIKGLILGSRSRRKASNPQELSDFFIQENDTFVQVIRGEELMVTKEQPIKTDEDKNLDKFLGDYSSMKEIFQQQINRGKFELIC